jgi:hypothetical protein
MLSRARSLPPAESKRLTPRSTHTEAKYKVETAVVAADLSSTDPKIYQDIAASIAKIGKVGVLGTLCSRPHVATAILFVTCVHPRLTQWQRRAVNNVGLSYDWPTKYLNLPKETEEALIQMNIKTMHELTRIVLPQMVEKYAALVSVPVRLRTCTYVCVSVEVVV